MKQFPEYDPDTVANGARYLVELIGQDHAQRMVERFGGLELAIPKSCNPERSAVAAALVDAIGEDAAQRICATCGDTRLYVPKGDSVQHQVRNERIRTAYDSGTPVDDIARHHGLSARRIRDILVQGGA